MKKIISKAEKWKIVFLAAFIFCMCLVPVHNANAASYSTYLTNGSNGTWVYLSVGDSCALEIYDESAVYFEYYPSDSSIIMVGGGEIYAVGSGVASVTVIGYDQNMNLVFSGSVIVSVSESSGNDGSINDGDNNGDIPDDGEFPGYEEEIIVPVDMTNVTLDKTSLKVKSVRQSYGYWYWYSTEAQLTLENTPQVISEWMDNVDFSYTSSNENMYVYCGLYDNVINIDVDGIGTTKLEFTINGKVFECKLKVIPVYMKDTGIILKTGDTYQLKVKKGGADVTWESLDESVATVSAKGLVKAKKTGTAVIIATLGEHKFGCAVNVTTASMKSVVDRAVSIAKGTYSQEKRMQSGYYDCSSLVWRAYSPSGMKFGNNNWAPVAADIGKWSMENGKKISDSLTDEQVQKQKLQVGDLLFKTGSSNGRYQGIDHVEMFIGYAYVGMDYDGTPYLTTKLAARSDGYGYGMLVVRPKK